MTKDKLTNGMIVETRNGNRYIVVNDVLMRREGYMNKSDLDDNLKARNGMDSLDIMKVYEGINILNLDEADVILWEREVIKPKVGDIYMDESNDERFIIIDINEDYLYPYFTVNICNNIINSDRYNKAELSDYKFVENNMAMARDFNMLFEHLKKAQ